MAPLQKPLLWPCSHPSLTSILDELLVVMGMPALPGPSPGADAIQGVDPALPSAPSLLDQIMADTGITHMKVPSLGAAADQGVDPALPSTSSLLHELLVAMVEVKTWWRPATP